MAIQLDHILVPSRDKNAAAKLLAELFGVRWEPSGDASVPLDAAPPPGSSEINMKQYRGQRASVYVSDSLTIDFVDARGKVPVNHYCFRVGAPEFDGILDRIRKAGLKYWSTGTGEPDYKINTRMGGKGVYFMEPDGHAWEILTVSYARPTN